MKAVADLHIHSKYSRAVSSNMVPQETGQWAGRKGVNLVGTGDWTHPVWLRELKLALEEKEQGIFKLRGSKLPVYFILSTELSCIYSQGGKTRRIHLLVLVPSFKAAEKINMALARVGVKLMSDGRPTIGMSAKDVVELVFSEEENSVIIPAHIWTPWFSLYGSNSGFDSLEECFGEYSDYITAVETGLSSDPAMNWRIEELTSRSIVSFSDAHSLEKLGREATVFELSELSFNALKEAMASQRNSDFAALQNRSHSRILYTIEFYPEEGKYHYTGHRRCGVKQSPGETKKKGTICQVCGKPLTIGVMHRVEQLAKQKVKVNLENDQNCVQWIRHSSNQRPPYVMMVPLLEILSETFSVGSATQRVRNEYEKLVSVFGSEFEILLSADLKEIEAVSGERVAEGIERVRKGDIFIDPGYDGVFGLVRIWSQNAAQEAANKVPDQIGLF